MSAEQVLNNLLAATGLHIANPQLSDADNIELRQILYFINEAGRDLVNRAHWAELEKTFTASADTDLPDDFKALYGDSPVRSDKAARGIVSPELWAFIKSRTHEQPYFRLSGGRIEFSAAGNYTIRYLSKNWAGTSDTVTQNGDAVLLPIQLMTKSVVWRWRRQKGLPYDDHAAEFEADLATHLQHNRGG